MAVAIGQGVQQRRPAAGQRSGPRLNPRGGWRLRYRCGLTGLHRTRCRRRWRWWWAGDSLVPGTVHQFGQLGAVQRHGDVSRRVSPPPAPPLAAISSVMFAPVLGSEAPA